MSVLILCAAFVSVAWGQQPGCKFSPLWAEFHKHNMMRWNRCENVLSVDNVSNLALKWSYTTDGEIGNLISPTVANGVVYVTSYDGMLYALDAHSGAMLWSYAIGFSVSSPAI